MVPKCVKERNALLVEEVVLANGVQDLLYRVAGYSGEEYSVLANTLAAVTPDLKDIHDQIVQSLREMSEEDLLWLVEVVGPSFLKFSIVREMQKNRPYLLKKYKEE